LPLVVSCSIFLSQFFHSNGATTFCLLTSCLQTISLLTIPWLRTVFKQKVFVNRPEKQVVNLTFKWAVDAMPVVDMSDNEMSVDEISENVMILGKVYVDEMSIDNMPLVEMSVI
jgi:hypothetical protein